MWVNGELRFSDEQLMRLYDALTLAMVQLDDVTQGLGPADTQLAIELEEKAEAFLSLETDIVFQLTEKVTQSWP